MTPKQLAKTILDAMDIREESWVDTPKSSFSKGRYTKNHCDATEIACQQNKINSEFEILIATLILLAWNESESWANKILEKKK